jgi:hypothetical protein
MSQNLIAYVIVTAAALYALWRFLPITKRAATVSHLMILARRCGLAEARAQRWQRRLSEKTGCGDCGPCKACKTNQSPRSIEPTTDPRTVV